jgi:hypothetical protein
VPKACKSLQTRELDSRTALRGRTAPVDTLASEGTRVIEETSDSNEKSEGLGVSKEDLRPFRIEYDMTSGRVREWGCGKGYKGR